MIVVDASAALAGLFNAGAARQALAGEQLHVPHLIDSEIVSGVRRRCIAGQLTVEQGRSLLHTWSKLGVTRYATISLYERIWALRDNLSAYDAGYVALAEALGCSLLTADRRISGAPGLLCPVLTVPS